MWSTVLIIKLFYASKLLFFRLTHLTILFGIVIVACEASAQPTEVASAGMAYSGDAASISQRFPYSTAYEKDLRAAGKFAYVQIQDALAKNNQSEFKFVTQLDDLKGRDRAIAVALVVGSETVSVERLGGFHKLFVLIRAQALFFDFKSMSVIRSYPISFGHIDVFDRPPTQVEVKDRVRGVFEGAVGKPGIFSRFGNTVTKASLPQATSRYLQITKVTLKGEALSSIPSYISDDSKVAETWAADLVGEALSTRAGVPIIPYSRGYAIGNVMTMRVSDGTVYDLKLPKPDYEISVEMSALRKIKYGEAAAGASYIYGSYASVKIEEPLSGKVYLNTALKNGEIKLVPASQTYTDDFPAFYDSVNGLFVKLSEALDGRGNTWIKTAAAATDVEKQILDTRELFKLCK
jgi:hypothetical protein